MISGPYFIEEYIAHEAIKPGEIVALNSDNEVALVAADAAAATGPVEKMVMIEQSLTGETIDDECTAGDHIQVAIMQTGCVFNGFLETGDNAAIGAKLSAHAGGTLHLWVASATPDESAWCQFVALDALNNTTGSPGRIRARVL